MQIELHKQVKKLLSGDPYDAMEAAKKLISIHKQVDPTSLIRVLEDHTCRPWSRIAAAYVLGFLEYGASSNAIAPALLRVLENSKEPASLRSHAAEALSNLGATGAISALQKVLHDPSGSKQLRKWCEFALSELKSGTQ